MAASKLLCLMVLFLAVSGSMAQTQPQLDAIVAACGLDKALKMLPYATKCQTALKTAKTCPKDCLKVKKLAKPAACSKSVNDAVPAADKIKSNKVCKASGRKLM